MLFRSFGDSALNFELHFIVRNVEERADVISNINFAIDKAFRAHGVMPLAARHDAAAPVAG